MLLERADAVVDDLPIGAVLLELLGAVPERSGLPEGGAGAAALADDLLLFEQFDEQHVPGRGRHDDEDAERRLGNQAALLERLHDAVRIIVVRRCCWGGHLLTSSQCKLGGRFMSNHSFGRTHRMRADVLSATALPVESWAGVKRARLFMIRQVAASSADDPLELVTLQALTCPSGPISRWKP